MNEATSRIKDEFHSISDAVKSGFDPKIPFIKDLAKEARMEVNDLALNHNNDDDRMRHKNLNLTICVLTNTITLIDFYNGFLDYHAELQLQLSNANEASHHMKAHDMSLQADELNSFFERELHNFQQAIKTGFHSFAQHADDMLEDYIEIVHNSGEIEWGFESYRDFLVSCQHSHNNLSYMFLQSARFNAGFIANNNGHDPNDLREHINQDLKDCENHLLMAENIEKHLSKHVKTGHVHHIAPSASQRPTLN